MGVRYGKPNFWEYESFPRWQDYSMAIIFAMLFPALRLLLDGFVYQVNNFEVPKPDSAVSYHMLQVWIQFSSDFGCAISYRDKNPISKVAVEIQFCCFLSHVYSADPILFKFWLCNSYGDNKHIPKVTVEAKMCWFLSYLGSLIYSPQGFLSARVHVPVVHISTGWFPSKRNWSQSWGVDKF